MSETQADVTESSVLVVSAKPDRKVYGPSKKARRVTSGVPAEILNNAELQEAIRVLPDNYNFEIPKTIWRIQRCQAKCVALQFPEGLLIYALTISDILEKFAGVTTIIMGDVTYGACCVDDYTARALGADLMVHYGHSCLIPVNMTESIKMLYIFVDIKIDTLHLLETVTYNVPKTSRIALLSTIQFISTIQHVSSDMNSMGYDVLVPQCKPLSPGEVLGCTSPRFQDRDCLVFVGDGRFHLESAMIANPALKSFRYNPYDKTFTEEFYDYEKMMAMRKDSIDKACRCSKFGIILGTLGRQGSPKVMNAVKSILAKANKTFVTVLLSEVFPDKLKLFGDVGSWVQIACPRLSIDWGTAFEKPLLTPYELAVAVNAVRWKERYPMDFYAAQSLGPWTPNHTVPAAEETCQKCEDCDCTDKK